MAQNRGMPTRTQDNRRGDYQDTGRASRQSGGNRGHDNASQVGQAPSTGKPWTAPQNKRGDGHENETGKMKE